MLSSINNLKCHSIIIYFLFILTHFNSICSQFGICNLYIARAIRSCDNIIFSVLLLGFIINIQLNMSNLPPASHVSFIMIRKFIVILTI